MQPLCAGQQGLPLQHPRTVPTLYQLQQMLRIHASTAGCGRGLRHRSHVMDTVMLSTTSQSVTEALFAWLQVVCMVHDATLHTRACPGAWPKALWPDAVAPSVRAAAWQQEAGSGRAVSHQPLHARGCGRGQTPPTHEHQQPGQLNLHAGPKFATSCPILQQQAQQCCRGAAIVASVLGETTATTALNDAGHFRGYTSGGP